jgi:hypothetical protein
VCGRFHKIWLFVAILSVAASYDCVRAETPRTPTSEFDIPYQISLLDGGAVMRISGSYSWALPQNLLAVLVSAPAVRTVWLDSPGGHIQPAIQVAEILKQHALDTFVAWRCASACTIAFLAGQHRSLGPDGKLGFHQAYAPDTPSNDVNAFLKTVYEQYGLPAAFIAHVLRIAHTDIWYPKPDELRSLKIVNAPADAALLALAALPPPRLGDLTALLARTPDEAVARFTEALCDLLDQLQAANPDACWAFAHEAPEDPNAALSPAMIEVVKAARARLAGDATAARMPAPDAELRAKATRALIEQVKVDGHLAGLAGLRSDAPRGAFCPALRDLLQAALTLPAAQRTLTLRVVLSGA